MNQKIFEEINTPRRESSVTRLDSKAGSNYTYTYTFCREYVMGQVTIYLEENIEKKMRVASKKAKLSQSKWIAGLIEEKLADEWPREVKDLCGAWRDFPDLEEIRSGMGTDIPRESF
jgi:hypothetical protein